jgi:hypothetical protein
VHALLGSHMWQYWLENFINLGHRLQQPRWRVPAAAAQSCLRQRQQVATTAPVASNLLQEGSTLRLRQVPHKSQLWLEQQQLVDAWGRQQVSHD